MLSNIVDEDEEISYTEVKNNNAEALRLLEGQQVLWREEKLQLMRAYCNASDELQPMLVDMDGVMVITKTFTSVRLNISLLNITMPIRPSQPITNKTSYKGLLIWELPLSQFQEYRLSLIASDNNPLKLYRKALERRFQMLSPSDRNRMTVVRNDLGSGLIKVNQRDVTWMYNLMNSALRDLCFQHPQVRKLVVYGLWYIVCNVYDALQTLHFPCLAAYGESGHICLWAEGNSSLPED